MPELRFNPILEIGSLQRELNRMLDLPVRGSLRESHPSHFSPALQVWETSENYTVQLLIPSADRNSLDIEATPHQLGIKGEMKLPTLQGELRYQEIQPGSFQRIIKLQRRIQPEAVTAHYTDGLLTITLPKAETARVVKVQVGTTGETPEATAVSVEGQSA
ncbi:MAG: Hsp20/alpha crystallin family protein [Thermostichus sp. HHBFW_bins_43]